MPTKDKAKIAAKNARYHLAHRAGILERKQRRRESQRTAIREYDRLNNQRHRARKYGLTELELAGLFTRDGNACAVCGSREGLAVDHDHETGAVRGILCRKCNLALGLVDDNKERLYTLAAYLTERG